MAAESYREGAVLDACFADGVDSIKHLTDPGAKSSHSRLSIGFHQLRHPNRPV
jgi:hypothetical protein